MPWRNVVICDKHWKEEEGDREPVRIKDPAHPENLITAGCYRCGALSTIYVRRFIHHREASQEEEVTDE